MNETNTTYIYSVSLALTAHREAERQASQHASPAKYQQVYYNVLAKVAVDYYLQIFGIPTNLEKSESNDLIWQSLFNISDLVVIDRGRIECVPIVHNASYIEIAPETIQDRIAHVFVELEPHLRSANILGFLPQVSQDIVYREELELIELLPEYLEKYANIGRVNALDIAQSGILATVETRVTCLTEWLQARFLGKNIGIWTPELEPAFRRIHPSPSSVETPQSLSELQQFLLEEIKNCKNKSSLIEYCQRLHKIAPKHPQAIANLVTIIETAVEETLKWNAALILGEIDPQHLMRAICCFKIIKIDDRALRLRLAIRQERINNYIILVGVYPVDSEHCLLYPLKLQVFDEFDNLAIADCDTNKGYLQVQIDGARKEKFGVKITSGRQEMQEYFAI